jgi:hypothetical protein
MEVTVELYLPDRCLLRSPIIRIGSARPGPSGKFVENSTKLTCLEVSDRIKYSTVLWLLELQIRRGRKV